MNPKLRKANGKGKAFSQMLDTKPSELAKKHYSLPRRLWNMMGEKQKKIFLYHRNRKKLATDVSEFKDIRIESKLRIFSI